MAFVIPRGAFVHGIVVWLAVSGSVMASGTLPVLPVTETLPDFAACLARLEALAAEVIADHGGPLRTDPGGAA